jgi:predicted transposase YbfD/YdcC
MESPNLYCLEFSRARTQDFGHGRMEKRSITVCDCPSGYLSMKSASQVFCISRERLCKSTGVIETNIEYGLTDLSSSQVSASSLLKLLRGHWVIENRSHYVRDVTLGEDSCRARTGELPSVLSLFRGAALNLNRRARVRNVAATCRRFAARPHEAIRLLKQKTE